MRKLTLILVMAVATLAALAQGNILVVGVVTDKETNQPLSMAAIQVKNTQLGALSEDNGYFEMPLPVSNLKDSIRVSYVGYTPESLSIADYKTGDTLRIALGMDNMIKGEVVITALGARAVMLKAIENMKKNFYYDSLISTGLYRQYHKENGKYVRLMEADVSVAFNVKSPYKYSFHELVRVNKQRRSDNYETNGDVHGDHLVDLLKQNAYSYNRASFLDAKKIDFYAPKMLSENEKEYVITLQYKEANSATLE
ncbi:MAG: carboxypeptidase-like regulatory domain-containing protein, partial [Bacteroidetes bacterium]|nr:carboxypeptidase-like regulatory domain-containing protein [Bacteroidota bacterium]